MSHFFECVSLWDGFACIDVESAKFSFGGGGHDGPDELGKVTDRCCLWGWWCRGHEKVFAGTAAHFGFAQVECVAVHNEHHVTFLVSDDGILVCCGIVKELPASRHGVLGRFSLGRRNYAERCEHGGVD